MLPNGHLRCEASLWGHLLFGIDVGPLAEQSDTVCSAASERAGEVPLLGYKYIQPVVGSPDAAYPTSTTSDVTIEQMWLAESGDLFFGDPGEDDIGFIAGVIDAVKTLPVRRVTGVSRTRGSTVLRFDRTRRLR
jgi:hypothetical protein